MSILDLRPLRTRQSHIPAQLPAEAPQAHRVWDVMLIAGFCAVLFFYGLTKGELYRTESLRAIIGAGFLNTGNWIVPTLYGEPLFTKPPGMYAAIALSSWSMGGVTAWSARLPSALAATASVFLFYWYFSRVFGRRGGLAGALMLPISFIWLDKASTAEIDMLQAFWVTAALLFFLRALEADEHNSTLRHKQPASIGLLSARGIFGTAPDGSFLTTSPGPLDTDTSWSQGSSFVWWLLALLCVAGGVLTKWTAPAFFYGTVIPLLWRRGRLSLLFRREHLVSALACAAVCLAWIATAVLLTGWHSFYDTVSQEALMRLLPSHHHRPYPWLESFSHPWKILAASLPWSALAVLTLWPGFSQLWNERERRLLQALHCWIWPNLFFWSIIPEHASRHSFPMFPAISGLAAMVWIAWASGRLHTLALPRFSPIRLLTRGSPATRPVAFLCGMLALWIVAKVVFVELVTPRRQSNRAPQAKGEILASLVPQGKTLYLFRLKDEGIMFYYGRPVRRLHHPDQLPSSAEGAFCILDESEWNQWRHSARAEVISQMPDEQGDPMVLVKVAADHAPVEKSVDEPGHPSTRSQGP